MNANKTRMALLSIAIVLGMLCPKLPSLGAEQSGGPKALGRQSKSQETQREPVTTPTAGARMPGEPGKPAPVQEVLIDGKVVRMEDALKASSPIVAGEQPSLEAAKALQPSGGGGQKDRKAETVTGEKHLQIVLQVTEDGAFEVVSASEVPGPATLTDEPLGEFVYEVSEGSRTLAAQALPDPFEMRSFSEDPNQGHHFERAKVATIIVKVPQVTLESPLESLSIKLLRVKPGGAVDRMNVEELDRLKQSNRIQTVVSIPAEKLAPQIRQRGRKMLPE